MARQDPALVCVRPLPLRDLGENVNAALFTSKRDDWPSPENVLERVRAFGQIGFDPCPNDNDIVNAKATATNGLEAPWKGRGLVYLNPPYGRTIGHWIEKAIEEHFENDVEIIALVPSRTDAKWFHRAINTADAVCFWSGRLKFLGALSSAPFPSALLYWGKRSPHFHNVFEKVGKVVML